MPSAIANDLAAVGVVKSTREPVSIVAANTSTTLWQLTTNRTAHVTKLVIANRSGSNIQVRVGQTISGAFTQKLPDYYCPNGQTIILTEDEIPAVDFYGDIIVRSTVGAAAPNDVQVTPEVREYGA